MRRHTVLSSWLPRFARFLMGGGTATALHYGIMQTLLLHGMPPTPAAMTGALTGAVVNYRLQRDMVFHPHRGQLATMRRYLAALGVGWLLNGFFFLLLHDGLHFAPLAAQASTTLLLVFLNYWLFKRYVFS